jgi:hypothetical protein
MPYLHLDLPGISNGCVAYDRRRRRLVCGQSWIGGVTRLKHYSSRTQRARTRTCRRQRLMRRMLQCSASVGIRYARSASLYPSLLRHSGASIFIFIVLCRAFRPRREHQGHQRCADGGPHYERHYRHAAPPIPAIYNGIDFISYSKDGDECGYLLRQYCGKSADIALILLSYRRTRLGEVSPFRRG